MSCGRVMSEIRDGLGCSGFTKRHLVSEKISVNVTRVITVLLALVLGLGALICGIGVCTAATFLAMSLAGGASILLAIILLALASFWSYGLFASCHGKKIQQ
ncbi:hypothetical protein [Chlamydia vaughanii]|uniref:hypothetical protein n=1 Tax=Chlamydia vaughanii TaxID=3112552 RepID=UPI0032B28CC1